MSVSPYTIHLKQESTIVTAVPSDCDFLYDFQPSVGYPCDGLGQQVNDGSRNPHLIVPSPSAAINIPSPNSSYHSMPYASSTPSTTSTAMMDPMSLSFSPSYHGVSPLSTSDDSFCFSPFSAQTDALSECQDEQAWLTSSSFQPDFTLDGLLNTTPSPTMTPSSPWVGNPAEPQQQTHAVLANEGSLLFAPPPPQSTPLTQAYDAYALSPPNLFVQEPHADQPQPIQYTYPQPHYEQYEEQQQQQQQQQQRPSMSRRRRATSTSGKIHRCPHCKHTSNRANNMKEHILTHDPHREKKFACNLCGKRFARKHDMKRHAKSPHTSLTSAL